MGTTFIVRVNATSRLERYHDDNEVIRDAARGKDNSLHAPCGDEKSTLIPTAIFFKQALIYLCHPFFPAGIKRTTIDPKLFLHYPNYSD
jgi:hypothetical protein